MEGRICPRCGYERKEFEPVPDTECPSCGIIYQKFLDRQKERQQQELAESSLNGLPGKTGRSNLWAAILALSVVLVMAGGAYVGYRYYWKGSVAGSNKEAASFPYDIRGTWKGRLKADLLANSGNDLIVNYQLTVEVGPEYQVENLRFTDIETVTIDEHQGTRKDKPEASCEISWVRPDQAELDCECQELRGNYTYPYLRISRWDRWLSVYYKHELGGEVIFEDDDVFTETRARGMDQDGRFEYDRSSGSLKATVDVRITPEINFILPPEAIESFRLPGTRLSLDQFQRRKQVARFYVRSLPLLTFRGMFIEVPGGPKIRINVFDPTGNAVFDREPYGHPPFYRLVNLNSLVEFRFKFRTLERKVVIHFYPDGKKTASVVGRKMTHTNIPLLFEMERE